MKPIFLLGGRDLEMDTIKTILREKNQIFFDNDLSWKCAVVSKYSEIISSHKAPDFHIYGIELREDITPPSNYTRIDHHNDFSRKDSSLKQIANLLNYELNRWQRLVSANDSAYMEGLEQAGATKEEITQIRQSDRTAQGVTTKEENLAETAILEKKTRGDLIIIQTDNQHFSPITDRLYPYKKLLIYNHQELVYYGEGQDKLIEVYKEEIKKGDAFFGGGENGFFGLSKVQFSSDEIKKNIELITNSVQ